MTIAQLNQSWLFRYKLYHIPFWFLYHYLWFTAAVGDPFAAAHSMFWSVYSIKMLFYIVVEACAVYFNLYYLIPKYLEKSKFIEYAIYLVITLLCCAVLITCGYYVTAYLSHCTVQKLFGDESGSFFHLLIGNPLSSTVASMSLAMSIKLTKNWVQTERRQRLLEKEKLETELKFLKYQFNPHFLFNSINSIFFLIHKNPDKASASLAKFSELLRHQLYECNDNQIPLSKEIDYLENFIELEKLRQNNNVEVTCDIEPVFVNHLGIAPFILMTFIENAFKHISSHADKPNWMVIKLNLVNEQLTLFIANSTSPEENNELVNYGGIGLKNVQRRLDLVYPNQYQLDIQRKEDSFEVKLVVNLSELIVSNVMQMAI